MKQIIATILALLILTSCKKIDTKNISTVSNKLEKENKPKNHLEDVKLEELNNQTLNFTKSVNSFIDNVLKENQRKHIFSTNDNNIQHLKIFNKTGLQEIIAFSDKRYPKSIEPNYYEHFILFAIKYENNSQAKISYETVKEMSRISNKEYKNLDEEQKKRIKNFEVSTKPGGMICQKANYVFSLVKTCRETPIGGKWEVYENLFLSFVTEKDEHINILNAHCGQMNYIEDKRNPHTT